MNILQIVTDKTNITIANTKEVAYYYFFQLVFLHLTLVNSNGQVQGHATFSCEYLANGDR